MPFQNFRPLPMRITHKQYERLQAAREYDHLAIQEHVRRALDFYLDAFERKIGKLNPTPPPDPEPVPSMQAPEPPSSNDAAAPTLANAGATQSRKKLVYR